MKLSFIFGTCFPSEAGKGVNDGIVCAIYRGGERGHLRVTLTVAAEGSNSLQAKVVVVVSSSHKPLFSRSVT